MKRIAALAATVLLAITGTFAFAQFQRMDVPNSPPYDVLLVKDDGTAAVYERHSGTSTR